MQIIGPISTIFMITLNRYVACVYPLYYRKHATRRTVYGFFLFESCVSTGICIRLYFPYKEKKLRAICVSTFAFVGSFTFSGVVGTQLVIY